MQQLNMTSQNQCKIQFTHEESLFIERCLSGFKPDNYDTYLSMLMRVLNNLVSTPLMLVTDKAKTMVWSIQEKICYYQATQELDNLLTSPLYNTPYTNTVNPQSTRRLSLSQVTKSVTSSSHFSIIKTLKDDTGLSRSELANRTGLKMSAVCARVKELMDVNLVKVVGVKKDSETDRIVQTLSVI